MFAYVDIARYPKWDYVRKALLMRRPLPESISLATLYHYRSLIARMTSRAVAAENIIACLPDLMANATLRRMPHWLDGVVEALGLTTAQQVCTWKAYVSFLKAPSTAPRDWESLRLASRWFCDWKIGGPADESGAPYVFVRTLFRYFDRHGHASAREQASKPFIALLGNPSDAEAVLPYFLAAFELETEDKGFKEALARAEAAIKAAPEPVDFLKKIVPVLKRNLPEPGANCGYVVCSSQEMPYWDALNAFLDIANTLKDPPWDFEKLALLNACITPAAGGYVYPHAYWRHIRQWLDCMACITWSGLPRTACLGSLARLS